MDEPNGPAGAGLPAWQRAVLAPVLALAACGLAYRAVVRGSPPTSIVYASPNPRPVVSYWPPEAKCDADPWTGRLTRVDQHLLLLTVRGSPEERGMAHGMLVGPEIRGLVTGLRKHLCPVQDPKDETPPPNPLYDMDLPEGQDEELRQRYQERLSCARAMGAYLEPDVSAELKTCALAAEVDPDELLLAQLFGDINLAMGYSPYCSSFAAFGPATSGGKLIVGRDFDYAGYGLEGGTPMVLQEIPAGAGAGRPFVTIGYAGILNGWTALNADGLCASNNTLFSGVDSMEGLSTCFMLRKIVERGSTVEDGLEIIQKGPRARTTGMLVAGRNRAGQWDARFIEFDHASVAVIEPQEGIVLGTNTCRKLVTRAETPAGIPSCARWRTLNAHLLSRFGGLSFDDLTENPVALEGVYMDINLHCALLDPVGQRFRLAVATGDGEPAATRPFRTFRVEAARVVEGQ